MDIQHLVDRLEDLIDEGRHIPFSKYTMIDEERALELIDQMRISIPEEIEKAARVLAQRDRILAQANEEAARVVQVARQRGEQMLDRESSVQAAQNRAVNIVEQARQEAETIIDGADGYALDVLSKLEQQLLKTLNIVRNGINEVNQTPKPSTNGDAPQPAVLPALPSPHFATPAPFQPVQVTVDNEETK
jgi:cell division septum initiation protein DivIVA